VGGAVQVGDGGVLLRWWTAASGSALPATAGRARETELTCMLTVPFPAYYFWLIVLFISGLLFLGILICFPRKRKGNWLQDTVQHNKQC
jgi:hypothetical protein